jgi:fructose-1,6-bisphosphatase/sedoheptulose 1,7-bisphosphatase-like protein
LKTQKHNQGSLDSLTVKIEKDVVEAVKRMAKNSGLSVDDIVVIALKRYRSSHSELEGHLPKAE